MFHILQYDAFPGDFERNAKAILMWAKMAKDEGATALIVSPYAVRGLLCLDYEKYDAVASALLEAHDLLKAAPLPILLTGLETTYLVENGDITPYTSPSVIHLCNERLYLSPESPQEDGLNIYPVLHTFDRHDPDYLLRFALETDCNILVLNAVGVDGERMWEGGSVLAEGGRVLWRLRRFGNILTPMDGTLVQTDSGESDEALLYHASVAAIKDYVYSCGFEKVVLGLSGGIDSALVAVLASAALGANNVSTFMLHTPHTRATSIEDARLLAQSLQVFHESIDLVPALTPLQETIEHTAFYPFAKSGAKKLVAENLQPRVRMSLLMAQATLREAILLGTSNRSELLAGFGTLYGDLAAGYNPLKDFSKAEVYAIARYANTQHQDAIPESIFQKAPSAELYSGQKDSDSLPEYDIFERLTHLYLDKGQSIAEIAEQLPISYEEVATTIRRIRYNEFKRRQAAPGFICSHNGLGEGDWRYPLLWQGPIG